MDTSVTIIRAIGDSVQSIISVAPTEKFDGIKLLELMLQQLPTIAATVIGALTAFLVGLWGENKKSITNLRTSNISKRIDTVSEARKQYKKIGREIMNSLQLTPDSDYSDYQTSLAMSAAGINKKLDDFVDEFEANLDMKTVRVIDDLRGICEKIEYERATIESQHPAEEIEDYISIYADLGEKYSTEIGSKLTEIENSLTVQLERHLDCKL